MWNCSWWWQCPLNTKVNWWIYPRSVFPQSYFVSWLWSPCGTWAGIECEDELVQQDQLFSSNQHPLAPSVWSHWPFWHWCPSLHPQHGVNITLLPLTSKLIVCTNCLRPLPLHTTQNPAVNRNSSWQPAVTFSFPGSTTRFPYPLTRQSPLTFSYLLHTSFHPSARLTSLISPFASYSVHGLAVLLTPPV